MAIPDGTLDLQLAVIATATRVSYCSAAPANFAGIAAVSLGDVALTAGNGNGDWLIENGDTSGRKLSMLAQAADAPAADGTVNYLVWDDSSTMLATCPTAAQEVTTGQSWIIPKTKVQEIRDPTYA